MIDINKLIDNFKWVARLWMHVKICMPQISVMVIQIILSVDLRHITIILFVVNVVMKITVPSHPHGGNQQPEKNGLMNDHVIIKHVNKHVNQSQSKLSVNLFNGCSLSVVTV